eukprot:RCo005240
MGCTQWSCLCEERLVRKSAGKPPDRFLATNAKLEDFAVEYALTFLGVFDLCEQRLVCRRWARLARLAALHTEEHLTLLGKWVGSGASEGLTCHMKVSLDLHTAREKAGVIPVEGAVRWRFTSFPANLPLESAAVHAQYLGNVEVEWVRGSLARASQRLEFEGFGRSGTVGLCGITGHFGQFPCRSCGCAQYISKRDSTVLISACEACRHSLAEHGYTDPLRHWIYADKYRMTLPSRLRADSKFTGISEGLDASWSNTFECQRAMPFQVPPEEFRGW